jgi:hypothetical protein
MSPISYFIFLGKLARFHFLKIFFEYNAFFVKEKYYLILFFYQKLGCQVQSIKTFHSGIEERTIVFYFSGNFLISVL